MCHEVTLWGRSYGVGVKEGPRWNAREVWPSKLSQAESFLVAENSNHPHTQKSFRAEEQIQKHYEKKHT